MNALIVVDVQNDFMPGGPLAAPGADEIIPEVNDLMDEFRRKGNIVVATQDWHPSNHGSFASNHEDAEIGEVIDLNGLDQIMWPDHCIQGSEGAEFVDALNSEDFQAIFRKGIDPEIDSYSGFYDNGHRRSTGLASFLQGEGVENVYIVGVATDYCIKWTALDAVKEGFNTHIIESACEGVEMEEGDISQAKEEMESEGVTII